MKKCVVTFLLALVALLAVAQAEAVVKPHACCCCEETVTTKKRATETNWVWEQNASYCWQRNTANGQTKNHGYHVWHQYGENLMKCEKCGRTAIDNGQFKESRDKTTTTSSTKKTTKYHTHSYEYKQSASYHWLECSCGLTKGASEYHKWVSYDSSRSLWKCSVCGRVAQFNRCNCKNGVCTCGDTCRCPSCDH